MNQLVVLETLLSRDPVRWRALGSVAALGLPDCWIGAGFIRDAVWDHLHGCEVAVPNGDVDVIWHDDTSLDREMEQRIEEKLRRAMPGLLWSAKNQARMHLRNGDAPYGSVAGAMRHWPETATAVAIRLAETGAIEVNAPFGLDDLFALRLRPTPHFTADRFPIFSRRVIAKRWIERYPKLTLGVSATA